MVLNHVNNEIVEHFDSAERQPKRDIVNNLFSNVLLYKYNTLRVQKESTKLSHRYMWTVSDPA